MYRQATALFVIMLSACGRLAGSADTPEVSVDAAESGAGDSALAESSVPDLGAADTPSDTDASVGAEIQLEGLGAAARLLANVGVACFEKRCFVALVQHEPNDYGKGLLTCPAPTKTVLLGFDAGALQFSTCINDLIPTDIAADSAGVAISGYQSTASGRVATVGQFSNSGDPLWRRSFPAMGAKGQSVARSVSIDSTSGDVIATFEHSGSVDFGVATLSGACTIARLSTKGVVQWAQSPSVGVSSSVASSSVTGTVTPSGSVLVSPAIGTVAVGSVSTPALGSGELGLALARFDSKGTALAVRAFRAESGLLSAVKVRADAGAVYVSGYAGGRLLIKDGCQGGFLAAFDGVELSPKWMVCWADFEPGVGLAIDNASGSLLVGGAELDKGQTRAFVRRVTTAGASIGALQSSLGRNRVTDLAIRGDGRAVAVGYFSSPLLFPATGKSLTGRADLPSYASPAFLAYLSL